MGVGAAYGVVVAVFQHGFGASLLGIDGDVPIVSFVPLFMFAILFGLSMDYNVFLQSRIREEYMRGASAEQSVVLALSRVGRIILAAGAIMTSVFLGFVSDADETLLGDRAWTLPAWLDRALPRISLEGEIEPAPARA